MSRPPLFYRWRKRILLPSLAPPPRPCKPKPFRRTTTISSRPPAIHALSLLLLASTFLLLAFLTASAAPFSTAVAFFFSAFLSSPHRSDPRAIHLARRAVRDLLHPDCHHHLPHALFANDPHNMALLVHVARIPPVFASRLGPRGRRNLLRRLTLHSNGILVFDSMPRVLIVDVQNGLGNRLRALGSALEFAFYTRRVLVVLWAPDPHINATMHDLFDTALLHNLIVIDQPVSWPIDPTDAFAPLLPNRTVNLRPHHLFSDTNFRYFSLMAKDKHFHLSSNRIENVAGMHVYVKTAYILNSKWTRDNLINAFIQALRPAPQVLKLVRQVEDRAGGPLWLRSMIGVHIRSRSILQDNDAVDHECEYSVEGAAVTDKWRQMSTPKQFIPEMHRIRRRWASVVGSSYALTAARRWSASTAIAQANSHFDLDGGPPVPVDLSVPPRFYVSADSVETLEQLYTDFQRDDIVYLPRKCDDRGAACILYAFADIIVLSRTAAMLASGWSSFSEAAARLRVRPFGMDPSRNDGYFIQTSGIDFGAPSSWETTKARWKTILRYLGLAAREQRSPGMSQEERRNLCRERREKGTTQGTNVT